jgi:protein TonB
MRPGRLSGSLPLSIAVHAAVLVAIFIIPIVTDDTLPVVSWISPPYILATAAPPPPPVVRIAATQPRNAPPINVDAAPTVAPDRIAPETPRTDASMPDLPLGDVGGSPGDLGVVGERAPNMSVITPPPPPKPAGPIRVSELVRQPKKIVDVRPEYPDIARKARVEGIVVLEAILDRGGRVDQVRVVQSQPLLDQAALDAVRQWRYTPTVLNGQPVAVLMTITIRFTLQ